MRLIDAARREARQWLEAGVRGMPGAMGRKLRARLYPRWLANPCRSLGVESGVTINGWTNVALGDDVSLGRGCTMESRTGTVSIGSRASFNHGVWLGADSGRISIGSDVMIGPYVIMRAADHRFDAGSDMPYRMQGHTGGTITIGDNVWIGGHCSIVAGAVIGANSVIAAGAVVCDEIPENSLAAGVPARVIRTLA